MKRDPLAYINVMSKYFTPNEISNQCLFTIDGAGLYNCKPNYCTIRHNDNSYMIACVLTGSAILEYRKKTYYLKEGQMFFIDCHNEPHQYFTGSSGIWEQLWFHFNSRMITPLYEFFYNSNDGPVVDTVPEVIKIIQSIMNAHTETSISDDVKFSGMITKLLYLILTSSENSRSDNQNDSFNQQNIPKMVINYIKANYNRKITLREIAEHVYLNPSYLSRIFKKYTGLSPYAYIIRYRIIKAKQALLETDQGISTIALDCGFQSVSRFCKLFHEFEGITPKQFRQRSRNIH